MDEDVEFRDMVLKKLEENGSLLEIKAKLRAHLYDVIENDGRQQQPEVINDSDLTTFNGDKTEEGDDGQEQPEEEVDDRTMALSLVQDLLECLKMPFTKRVLLAESGLRRPCSRERLQRELSFDEQQEEKEALLLQLIRNRKLASEISPVSRDRSESTTITTPAASEESSPP